MGSDQARREKDRLPLSGEFAQSIAGAGARAKGAIQSGSGEFRLDRGAGCDRENRRRTSRNERGDSGGRQKDDRGGDWRSTFRRSQSGAEMQDRRGKRATK